MANKIIPINYTSRDFTSIKSDLVQHAKRYYPNSFKDFNDASFGSLMFDAVAYIGDILSFYLDYQANESFLDTAVEYENILKLGRSMGYKFSSANTSTGLATFYINIPVDIGSAGPDKTYMPVLKKGSVVSTTTGVKFILNEDVRFDNPLNEIRVSVTDDSGAPLYYAVKAEGTIVSGLISSERITVGAYERYPKINLRQSDIIEILSVYDLEGNQYYEVENLSQNIVYRSITNRDSGDTQLANEVLKPFIVPRRFVVNRNLRTTQLQFGASSDIIISDRDNMLAEPTEVVLDMLGKEYISSDQFDPYKLLNSDKMGIAPSNTDLIITYRYNNINGTVNFATNTINKVTDAKLEFIDESSLITDEVSIVKSSLEVTNLSPILGDSSTIDSEELKRRIESSFSAQGRAVTETDYKALVYTMPNKFGSIKRVSVKRDEASLKRNLNLYVLCEDQNGYLTSANKTVKNNIKSWLTHKKMINDSIDILDGKIVNYGINFSVIGVNSRSKYDILADAMKQLKIDFSKTPDFGETFSIIDVYTSLKKVDGVIDVSSVTIEPKIGGVYSDTQFNFEANTSADQRFIYVPLNVVMEMKFPDTDIKGTIT